MSRIRTIKPEFWTNEKVVECSTNARLLFIGIWNFCDDKGNHPASEKTVKGSVFPCDNFTTDEIRGMLDELEENGLLEFYANENKQFFNVLGWEHQKIDKPQKARYPSKFDEHSTIIRRMNSEPSTSVRRSICISQTTDLDHRSIIPDQDPQTEPIDRKSKKPKAKIDLVDFDTRFWPAYPHKVGKPAASRAFASVIKKASIDQILAGLDRYIRDKPPDRPWCNPSTWLNQDRWLDQPAPAQIMANGHRGPITAFSRPTVGDEIAAFEQSAARHEANAKRIRAEIEADKQKTLELGNGKLGEHSRQGS